MSDATKFPMCSLCGHAHRGGEHVWGDERRNVTAVPVVARNVTCKECGRLKERILVLEKELARIKEGSAKRVKAYRERRKGQ